MATVGSDVAKLVRMIAGRGQFRWRRRSVAVATVGRWLAFCNRRRGTIPSAQIRTFCTRTCEWRISLSRLPGSSALSLARALEVLDQPRELFVFGIELGRWQAEEAR